MSGSNGPWLPLPLDSCREIWARIVALDGTCVHARVELAVHDAIASLRGQRQLDIASQGRLVATALEGLHACLSILAAPQCGPWAALGVDYAPRIMGLLHLDCAL